MPGLSVTSALVCVCESKSGFQAQKMARSGSGTGWQTVSHQVGSGQYIERILYYNQIII